MLIQNLKTSEIVSPADVGHAQLNFGQPQNLPEVELLVSVGADELQRALADAYAQLVRELRQSPADFTPDVLIDAGTPSFDVVCRDEELARHVLSEYLLFDLLGEIAGSDEPRYWAVALAHVGVLGQEVLIKLRAVEAVR